MAYFSLRKLLKVFVQMLLRDLRDFAKQSAPLPLISAAPTSPLMSASSKGH